ncbi:MAG: condensation domain-containing protein [Pirellulaceae bacterium]
MGARALASDMGEQMRSYWRQHIDGAPHNIDLPTDHPRPAIQSFRGATLGFKLDDDLTHQVLRAAAQQNVTLFTLLLSTYNVLLHRYTGQGDFLVGCPMAGRQHSELRQSVGYYVNPVPLRTRVDDDPTFFGYLRRTKEIVSSGLENQQYPFKRLVQEAGGARDTSRSPLFQVAFSMEHIPGFDEQGIAAFLIGEGGYKFHLGDVQMESIDLITRQAQFEIMLVVEEAGGNIYGCWQYNRDLFDAETIERLNEMYCDLLGQLTRDSAKRISQYSFATTLEFGRNGEDPDDEEPIDVRVQQWNQTERAAAGPPTSSRTDRTAGRENAQRPRRCLWQRLADLSRTQRKGKPTCLALAVPLGVGPDVRVGLAIQRELQLVVSIQAILKAGGATFRSIRAILKNDSIKLPAPQSSQSLLPMRRIAKSSQALEQIVCFDADQAVIAKQRDDNPPSSAGPGNLIYVIYTSGSTGVPKGVGVYHHGFANLIDWFTCEFEFDSSDRSLVVTSHGFDLTQRTCSRH